MTKTHLLCPKCGGETIVLQIAARARLGGLRRRRMCRDCRVLFTTLEMVVEEGSE